MTAPPPLVATKFRIPPARPQWVPRPRLLAHLTAGAGRPVTLISAPPGFGKTSLVCEWLAAAAGRDPQAPQAAAWLALEPDDNDPARFLLSLITAVQTLDPGRGAAARSLLHGLQPPPPRSVLTALLNELNEAGAAARPAVLVLDDYHVIDTPALHDALAFFVDHLPPHLRLLITSRADPAGLPLARWRVRDQLTELRAEALRFTPDEAADFLQRVMGLDLPAGAVAVLAARTEGWAAGLQLAALSLRGRADVAGFIAAFSGSHRHVLGYLAAEVLAHQPPDVLDFLLRTAIAERLCGPLCDALVEGGGGQAWLERLEAANLFLLPLDDHGQWYRYHPLFADVLRARLTQTAPGLVPALHRRAAEWHAAQGLLAEAIPHASAAADWGLAARLIDQAAMAALERGELTTLLGWLRALPDERVQAEPSLAAYAGWTALFAGDTERAEAYGRAGAAALADQPAGPARGRLEGLAAQLLVARHAFSDGVHRAQAALAQLAPDDFFFRSLVFNVLALAQQSTGDTHAAIASLRAALALGERSGQTLVVIAMRVNLAMQLYWQGRRREALALCEQARQRALDPRGRPLPIASMAAVALGLLAYEADDLAAARAHLDEGLRLGEQLGLVSLVQSARQVLAQLQQASGDTAAALETVRAAQRQAQFAGYAAFFAALEAQLQLQSGDLAAAQRWAETAGLPQARAIDPWQETEYFVYARVLLAQRQPQAALALLAELEPIVRAEGRDRWLITLLVLRAVAEQALGRPTAARQALAQAVGLAAPEDFRRAFLDEGAAVRALLPAVQPLAPAFVAQLLAAGPARPPAADAAPPLAEPLSAREMEVLQLIADGLANPEIAARLVVSTGTVKTHVNHLFRKLDARSRTQAVARARALGLLAR